MKFTIFVFKQQMFGENCFYYIISSQPEAFLTFRLNVRSSVAIYVAVAPKANLKYLKRQEMCMTKTNQRILNY
jgi:hypothetical protein